jgi:hydrogenase maturation protein HypF
MPTNTEPDTSERSAGTVTVRGTVQAVGFRPFVARLAAEHGLAGSVANTDAGVEIHLEGQTAAVERAVERVQTDPPRLATITDVEVADARVEGFEKFEIVPSADDGDRTTLVPPDTAVCPDCREELLSPTSRFSDYWATSCVNCGPRFSVVESLPYDRATTALSEFEPCQDCREEYEAPTDRRFHAQTIACPSCGPTLSALAPDGMTREEGPVALDHAAGRLDDGDILALKGSGGCHLTCLATDPVTVGRLRERLGRPAKPFAVMARSLSGVRKFATVEPRAAELLTGKRRPVVLLPCKETVWREAVAPGLDTVGVMLPYSGLHHLLFDRLDADLLVMTSANRPGEPTATDCSTLRDLAGVFDGALVHDRPVVNRCDDSVVRVVNGDCRLLRRSRGYVPEPLDRRVVPEAEVLAVGAGTDVTVGLTRGEDVVLSQHVGDPSSPAVAAAHREATDHLCSLLDVQPDVAVHDYHPDLETTSVAADRPEPTMAVQHHHAHAASLLAEHERERAIVVAADGTGYGPAGVVRGGEVLDSTLTDSERVGGLSRFVLPGGEAAVDQPVRVAAALLSDTERARSLLQETDTVDSETEADAVLAQADSGVNSVETTSAGRFLDAVAALTGVCTTRRYQGEPAMRLEAVATDPSILDPPLDQRGGQTVLDVSAAFDRLADLADRRPPGVLAATAQRLLGRGLAEIAVDAATRRGVDAVGFTGGVAYNEAIDRTVRERVETGGLCYLGHDCVPPGDAGIAYGQAVTASARLAESDGSSRLSVRSADPEV